MLSPSEACSKDRHCVGHADWIESILIIVCSRGFISLGSSALSKSPPSPVTSAGMVSSRVWDNKRNVDEAEGCQDGCQAKVAVVTEVLVNVG